MEVTLTRQVEWLLYENNVQKTANCHHGIGVSWGDEGGQLPLQYFYYLRIAFRRVHKIAKSDYELRHICTSVRMELVSHWTDFHEI